jgi:hypothetical protein
LQFIVIVSLAILMLVGGIAQAAKAQNMTLAPQIPLQDIQYPNENPSDPLVMNVTNAVHQFMIDAYRAQLANHTQAYTIDVYLNNAMVCVHALMNNNAEMLSGCDNAVVQVKLLINQLGNTTPPWFTAYINEYLKARGIE